MGTINEESVWHDSIYALDTVTPVRGGTPVFDVNGNPTDGFDNASAKQLADRSKFLKDKLDNLPVTGVAYRKLFKKDLDFLPGATQLDLVDVPTSKESLLVFFDAAWQQSTEYSLTGSVVTFTAPIPVAVNQVEIIYGISGVVEDINGVKAQVEANTASLEALADATDPTKGVAGLGYILDAVGAVGRSQQDINGQTISVKDFGAIGDGTLHPVSEWIGTRYPNLAALQIDYPHVTATTDAIDWAAFQSFLVYLGTNGGHGIVPTGTYVTNKQISLSNPTHGFTVTGAGYGSVIALRATSAATAMGIVAPKDSFMCDFRVDCGRSVTGFGNHGISVSNPNKFIVARVDVVDYGMSAGLMFVTAPGLGSDAHFVDCNSDGMGTGRNGFLLEGIDRGSLTNCHARNLDMAQTPGIGLQLKNNCTNSYIIGGTAVSCVGGVGMGGDGDFAGTGPINCHIIGSITKNCMDGLIVGKTTDCSVDISVDQQASPAPVGVTGYAVNVAGFNQSLSISCNIYNVQAGRTAIRVGSSATSIRVKYVKGYGDKLALLVSGVQNTDLVVDTISGATNSTNIIDLITDSSGQTTNRVSYTRDLPNTGLAGTGFIRFPTAGSLQNWISFSASLNAFTFRTAGADRFVMAPGVFRAATNGVSDLGTTGIGFRDLFLTGGVTVGGNKVLGVRQAAIPDVAAAPTAAEHNAILAVLRAHGLIGT